MNIPLSKSDLHQLRAELDRYGIHVLSPVERKEAVGPDKPLAQHLARMRARKVDADFMARWLRLVVNVA